MRADSGMVRKLSSEDARPPIPSSDAEDGGDGSHAGAVDERTRGILTINPDVEILMVLRTLEEMTLSLYRMAQGVYGGIGQLDYAGADDKLVEEASHWVNDIGIAGALLGGVHDSIATEIEQRRGRVKEILRNEKAPDARAPGASSYM